MAKNLLIVESPAKAKTIEGYLGKDFLVKSSYGHIRDLVKGDMGIDINNNFTQTYEVPADKKQVVAELKKLAKNAEMVWLASDEDREGEAISWHLFETLGLKEATTKYLYQIMVETSRGLTWMKAGLPSGTELAHRTGVSGTNDDNLRVAMNNIGIVKLPNGKHFILSVYLKNITEKQEDTEKIIADIARVTWNYFTNKKN